MNAKRISDCLGIKSVLIILVVHTANPIFRSIKSLTGAKLSHSQNLLIFIMLKLFSRYVSIGVINTALHWVCFVMFLHFGASQAFSNLGAFCIAVTFSFFANAKWTFRSSATSGRYIAFVAFMGTMAALMGYISDAMKFPPVLTLFTFSGFSLIAGFICSKLIVFRDAK